MLTLPEISEYIKTGKRKYGESLIFHMKKYYDENHSNEYVRSYLEKEYNIKLSLSLLQKIKNAHYKKTIIDIDQSIVQKQENKTTPLQEINKKDSRTDYQKLRDSLELPDLNSAEEIIRRENEKNEKLKNLLKRKKD